VNHHAGEFNGAFLHADLNRAILSLRLGDGDAIVVCRSIHMGFAQIRPSAQPLERVVKKKKRPA
jgi:hypothetical protein